jgi:hypothetical protein
MDNEKQAMENEENAPKQDAVQRRIVRTQTPPALQSEVRTKPLAVSGTVDQELKRQCSINSRDQYGSKEGFPCLEKHLRKRLEWTLLWCMVVSDSLIVSRVSSCVTLRW